MKKILFFITMLVIFPIMTHAKDDSLTITNFKTYVIIGDYKNYSKEDTFKTKLIYGSDPNTTKFVFKIPKNGVYVKYGSKKEKSYNIENSFYGLKDDNDTYIYLVDSDDDYDYMYVGRENELLHENEEFTVSYEVNYNSYKEDEYNLILFYGEYTVNTTNFEIVLPDNIENMKYLFSLDGKKYYDEVDGIKYRIEYGKMIGTYDKKIDIGSSLYLKMIPDYSEYSSTIRNIVFYGVISIVSLYCIFSIVRHMKNKK